MPLKKVQKNLHKSSQKVQKIGLKNHITFHTKFKKKFKKSSQ